MTYPREVHYSELRSGDKVELTNTVTGDVIQTWYGHINDYNEALRKNGPKDWTYRLLARRSVPKAGDSITGNEVFDLPVGSLIFTPSSGHVWVVTRNSSGESRIIDPLNTLRTHAWLSGTYKVKYINEGY